MTSSRVRSRSEKERVKAHPHSPSRSCPHETRETGGNDGWRIMVISSKDKRGGNRKRDPADSWVFTIAQETNRAVA